MNLSAALFAACFAVFGLRIPAYALIAITGMLAALWLSLRTAPLCGLEPEQLWDAGVFAIAAAFVLSRLLGLGLFVVVERGQLTLSFRDILSFSSISYLSLLVTAIPVLLWLRWKHLPLLRAMDAWAPCGALLWSALSLADAVSGTGGGLPTRLPWGVRAASSSAGTRVHPVALYSAAAALALCGTLFTLLRRIREPGRVAAIGVIASGTTIFLLDMLRVPDQPQAQPLSHNLLDVSQWIALAAIVFGACLFAFVPRARQQEAR
jgi:phosphatidylglycerol:prolipoprotein diacylglycerol transferase